MDPRLKKLRISTGVVKRCGKEKLSYRKEADMQRGKIEKMKTEGKDEADIKKMNEVIQKMNEVIHPHSNILVGNLRSMGHLAPEFDLHWFHEFF